MALTSDALDADLTAELFDFGDDEDIDVDEPPAPPQDEAGVNRLLRAVRYLERCIDNWSATAEADIAATKAWRDKRVARARSSIAFLERSLEVWMRAHEEATSTVTTSLPQGTLRVRPAKMKLTVTDEAAAVAWAIENGYTAWVRPKPSEIAKDPAGKDITTGPVVVGPDPAPDGYEWREARVVTAGEGEEGTIERVPGIVALVPTRKTFGYTTTKETAAEPQEATPDE